MQPISIEEDEYHRTIWPPSTVAPGSDFGSLAQAAVDAAEEMGKDFVEMWNRWGEYEPIAWREDAAEWQDIAESLAARLKELAPEVAAEIIDDDEPEARAFERASRIEPNAGTEFTVHRSRYHRSKLAVCVPTVDGFPARAALVLDEMGVRYSHRERAYLATDSQVRALLVALADETEVEITESAKLMAIA